MNFDCFKLSDAIVDCVKADGNLTQRINSLIDECERQYPHEDWLHIRLIDFESDSRRLLSWISSAFAGYPNGLSYRGLWFGLNNPVRGGAGSADIYLAASHSFDASSIKWACEADYSQDCPYLESIALAEIYRIAYSKSTGLENDAEYPLVLAYGAMLAKAALETINLSETHFFNLKGAAVGFDSGDFLFLGDFKDGCFYANIRAG